MFVEIPTPLLILHINTFDVLNRELVLTIHAYLESTKIKMNSKINYDILLYSPNMQRQ